MSAHKETAPTRREGRSQSKDQPRSILLTRSPRNYKPGCPAGCPPGRHECGVGTPLAELPPADKFQRGGRDKDWPERDHIGLGILRRMRATA